MLETLSQEQNTQTTSPTEGFIAKIRKMLDAIPSEFVQPKHLHELGFFGSHSAATHFVQDGGIPHVRISPYRILIQKEDVLAFLKEKYRQKSKKVGGE
ncbi:hypothetical protein [Waddlia chondrophila]|uniref:DNA-binding protein n=1 Tax=Waddlia chondrophila (strain ATCC VR-1470 / WSU 86-1044) TaxID=716544 RepID=D6YX21_WADCW|nr:hypothetical protein [Waddlia chondrophila]ADI39327.1 hypothetical protein wcw_p0016 [Waddlia chondrophila WSU 86-1044]